MTFEVVEEENIIMLMMLTNRNCNINENCKHSIVIVNIYYRMQMILPTKFKIFPSQVQGYLKPWKECLRIDAIYTFHDLWNCHSVVAWMMSKEANFLQFFLMVVPLQYWILRSRDKSYFQLARCVHKIIFKQEKGPFGNGTLIKRSLWRTRLLQQKLVKKYLPLC